MKKEGKSKKVNRRKFLQGGSAFAATTVLIPSEGIKIFDFGENVNKTLSIPNANLNNGISMPMLGFGTNTLRGETGVRCVKDAISVGYRLIDTAHIYGNEESVGEAIRQSGINREELFVTSKLWVSDFGYESAKKAFKTSIDKLGLAYLDLYLLHRPRGDVKGSWKALEELYNEGKIRAIGISNFTAAQIEELLTYAKIKPTVNQIETHVFFQQEKAHDFLKKSDIQMEAWSPFAAARNDIFSNQKLAGIGQKYQKTNAQICLRWLYQRGIVAIPRSSQKAHMIENLKIFDFELSNKDMQLISELDLDKTQFPEWK